MEKRLEGIENQLKLLTGQLLTLNGIKADIKELREDLKSLEKTFSAVLKKIAFEEDEAAMTYFKNKTIYDFSDTSTKIAYLSYIEFFNTVNEDISTEPMTQNKFNSTVRKLYPTLTISKTTKNGKQFYYFKNNL